MVTPVRIRHNHHHWHHHRRHHPRYHHHSPCNEFLWFNDLIKDFLQQIFRCWVWISVAFIFWIFNRVVFVQESFNPKRMKIFVLLMHNRSIGVCSKDNAGVQFFFLKMVPLWFLTDIQIFEYMTLRRLYPACEICINLICIFQFWNIHL